MKIAVMFSGGLDSRLVLKLMSEKADVIALHFKFPFTKDIEPEIKKFCEKHGVKLKTFDYTKGKLLKEYLEMIKKPVYGRGVGVNPCVDCKVFMLRKAKEYADKHGIDKIATGEVIGQRPMSQLKTQLEIIEKQSGLKDRLLRPLNDLGIQGRNRKKQIEMAKQLNIKYPGPAGGCLLCETALKNRLKFLIERGLNAEEVKLSNVGRHFLIDNCWVVIGRNEQENKIIEKLKTGEKIIPEIPGPSAVILDACNEKFKDKVNKLIEDYSKGGKREEFERYLL